ncbi:outer membrane protein TolC [Paucibacter oligotrophus]|uniref:Outer membrane protein TolC n=1 Tax=Roseateles oligotrophus TaxID=1769250 RepID=A0A840LH59_9BURK|nr:TolC family protein [Roseateles oligotrophus]MBB4845359.1 outer membrane protein TolC [Roseateles oligotrophus]
MLPTRTSPSLLALALLWAQVLTLGGCAAVAPPSQLPELQARLDTRLPAAAPLPQQALPAPSATTAWWQALQDPQLDALVQQAQARNLDLKAALASVKQARALAGLANREGGPQGSLGLSAQISRASLPEVDPYAQGLPRPPEQRLIGLSQSLSWELDLFGRVATAQAVAERELGMAQADLHAAQALLQAELVNRYVQMRTSQQGLALGQQQLELAEVRRQQLLARVKAGLADARELRAAEGEQALRIAEHAGLQAQLQQNLAAIALLCGQTPAALDLELAALRQPQALPILPLQHSLQLSEGLLQRLPQVARADAALRAGLGQQVLAERAHLPRLSLAATLGLNEGFSNLGQAGALRYAAGPTLQWDWLDAGRRHAREAAAQAGSERLWAQFEQTVLQALAEGESSLRGWRAQVIAWQETQTAELAATEAARYTRERHKLGLEPQLAALSSEAQRLDAQRRSLQQQAQALQAFVQVHLALGAWQPG